MAVYRIRASLLVLACALLAVLPGQATAQQAPRQVIRVSWFVPDAPTLLARARGALAAADLDIDLTVAQGSTPQMRGLSDGTYDLAVTAFDNVLAWSGREGAEIVAVAQTDRAVSLPVYVRPEIGDWEDLRGKPLAVDAVDTAFALVLRRVLLAHGLDLDRGDYSLVPVGGPPQRLASMARGETFAAILNPPTDDQAAALGMVAFGDHRDTLPDYPGTVLAIDRAWAAAHRDDLVAFLRVWVGAGEFIEAHPDQAASTLAKALNTTPANAHGLLPAAFSSGALNPNGLQSVLDLRTRFGYQLPMGDDVGAYLATEYYDAAVAERPASVK